MELSSLPKLKGVKKGKRRLGRGHGSGRGTTAGRGTKGQKSREKITLGLEGGSRTARLLKRLPYRRGQGNKVFTKKPVIVNVQALNLLPPDIVVDIKNLSKYGIVVGDEAAKYGVKILGNGELKKTLIINLPTSKGAAEKIKAAGGKITYTKISKFDSPAVARKIEKERVDKVT